MSVNTGILSVHKGILSMNKGILSGYPHVEQYMGFPVSVYRGCFESEIRVFGVCSV